MEKIEEVYKRLEIDQPTFSEVDDDWTKYGLSSTHFKALVSVTLSTMTHTPRVVKAATALYEVADTPEAIVKLDDDLLRELIRPVAHYNRKTQHLKKMCREIIGNFNGEVPRNKSDLLSLTGVGEKCANIMLNFEFNQDSIAVDSHVFRVLNRLGVIHTSSHEKASEIINKITPNQYKRHAHEWLIGFGMRVCHAKKPNCSECVLYDLCVFTEKTSEER